MSVEELKIRRELEIDVERELEAELKDEIYRLGLKLHRLYQQQTERKLAREKNQKGVKKNKALSELNINIKMEGGTKIEIKETRKGACENYAHKPDVNITPDKMSNNSKLSEEKCTRRNSSDKKFDWTKTLRTGACNAHVVEAKGLQSGRRSQGRLWDDSVQIDIVTNTTRASSTRGNRTNVWNSIN